VSAIVLMLRGRRIGPLRALLEAVVSAAAEGTAHGFAALVSGPPLRRFV